MGATELSGAVATATLQVHGNTLMLMPEKAVFLPECDTLLVADVHIGKATSFRSLGVPVPAGTTDETLSLLTRLVDRLAVKRIVFLGDFLHSARSLGAATFATLRCWRERHGALELTLVRGNHDDRAGDPPAALGFEVVDEPVCLGGLALAHYPRPVPGAYVLAGHLHPAIGVGHGLDRVRLPCFWLQPRVGVLPAFGSFTGTHGVRAQEGDRVFAVAEQRVVELDLESGRKGGR